MRKRQKDYHHGDLKRALIAEAVRQIDREGAGGVTLRDLARRIGVSHTAPYRHFPDKLSLLNEVAEDGFRMLFDCLQGAGEDLESLAWAYVQFAQANPMRIALMFGPELAACKRDEGEAVKAFDLVLEILKNMTPDVPEEELRVRAVSAWALAHGLAVLVMNGQLSKELESQSVEALTKKAAHSLKAAFDVSRESNRS